MGTKNWCLEFLTFYLYHNFFSEVQESIFVDVNIKLQYEGDCKIVSKYYAYCHTNKL